MKLIKLLKPNRRFIFLPLYSILLIFIASCENSDLNTAKTFLGNKNINDAIPLLEKVVKSSPKNAEAHYLLGKCYKNSGKPKNLVEKHFKKAILLEESYKKPIGEVYYNESLKLFTKGFDYTFKATYQTAIDLYTEGKESFSNKLLINILKYKPLKIDRNKPLGMFKNFRNLIGRKYDETIAKNLFTSFKKLINSNNYYIAQQYEDFILELTKSQNNKIADIYFNIGINKIKSDSIDNFTNKFLKKSIYLNPNLKDKIKVEYKKYIQKLIKSNNVPNDEILNSAIVLIPELKPKVSDFYLSYAKKFVKTSNLPEYSFSYFKKAIELDNSKKNKVSKLIYNYSLSYNKKNDLDLAIKFATYNLKLNSDYKDFFLKLQSNFMSKHVILLGYYMWTNINLNVSHFKNGDPIAYIKNGEDWEAVNKRRKPAWCYFAFDIKNKLKGKFYNWYAVNDRRGLAPAGYKIPGKYEWSNLKSKYKDHFEVLISKKWFKSKNANISGFNVQKVGKYAPFPSIAEPNAETAEFWTSDNTTSRNGTIYPIIARFETRSYSFLSIFSSDVKSDSHRAYSVRCIKKGNIFDFN